jgi:hypothetical protein
MGVVHMKDADTADEARKRVELAVATPPYIIWWTTQADCEIVEAINPDWWPEVLSVSFRSRQGRNGRARLWCEIQDAPDGATWDDNSPLCRAIEEHSAGGIVLHVRDRKALRGLPGVITTFDMKLYRG